MNTTTVFRSNKIPTSVILATATDGKVLILDCYHSSNYYIDLLIDFSNPIDTPSETISSFSSFIHHSCDNLVKLDTNALPNNELLSFVEMSNIDEHINQLQSFKNDYYIKAQNIIQHTYGYGVASKFLLSGFIVRKPEPQSTLTDSFGKTKMYW